MYIVKLGLKFLGSNHLSHPDNDLLSTTASVKRPQMKRVLQEQHRDRPEADHDHGHDLQLCLGQPAASPKYARAPDGKKVVSPGYSSRAEQPKAANGVIPTHIKSGKGDTPCVASRSATLISERATHSPSLSYPDQEEEHVHLVKSP